MRLLLDIGNTRIKWAAQTDRGISSQQAISLEGLSKTDLIDRVLMPHSEMTAVLVSNVAGESIAQQVRQAVKQCWQLDAKFVVSEAQRHIAGRQLRNAYPQPQLLGVDRWLSMLAAWGLAPTPVLVVSVGTAMTLDAINEQGQHLGGLIVPGPELMMTSLLHQTSDLAERSALVHDASMADAFFASNTRAAIEQGSLRAASALIERAYQQLAHLDQLRVVMTGGAAPALMADLNVPAQFVPDLVLQGLSQYE